MFYRLFSVAVILFSLNVINVYCTAFWLIMVVLHVPMMATPVATKVVEIIWVYFLLTLLLDCKYTQV